MKLKSLLAMPPWEWPKDAGDTIQRSLANRRAEPSDRLLAADLAGDTVVMNDAMAKMLLDVVVSPDEPEELRAKAAISFGPALELASTEFDDTVGGFDDPESVPISEEMYDTIQESLESLYGDPGTPKLVRRRILEASIRDPEPWHEEAVREAYDSGDEEWVLTAVFAMRWIQGFEDEVMESLESANEEIHFEAVAAAGNKELDAAWPHVVALVQDPETPKDLLIEAIGAVGSIRPSEAGPILEELADSDDEDIAGAAGEALMITELGPPEEEEGE